MRSPINMQIPRPRYTALLLPGYSPWLGWLMRALNADRVLLDDLHPFSRKSRVHRAKIRTPDGFQWLNIPFVSDDRRKPVNKVRIDDRRPWASHHLQSIEYNYRNSLYFDYYEPEIRSDFEVAGKAGLLMDAVRHLMHRQWIYLQLPDFPGLASDHFLTHDDLYQSIPDTMNNIATNPEDIDSPDWDVSDYHMDTISSPGGSANHEVVLQEPDSRNYQKPHPAATQPAFSYPEYRQHFPGFVPGCSMLDLLFEYGPEAWQVLDPMLNIPRSGNFTE